MRDFVTNRDIASMITWTEVVGCHMLEFIGVYSLFRCLNANVWNSDPCSFIPIKIILDSHRLCQLILR